MNKSWFYLGLVGSLSLAMTSCGDSGKPATPAASPSTVASPSAVLPPAASTVTPVASATTAPPTAAKSTKPLAVDVTAGLIAPTDGDNWAKTVSKGRTDPFAVLSLRAIEVVEKKDPLVQIAQSQKPLGKIAKTGSTNVKSGSNKSLPGIKVGPQIAAIDPATKPTMGTRTGVGSVDISRIRRSGVDRKLPNIVVAIKPGAIVPGRNPPITIKPLPMPSRDKRVVIRPLPQPYQPNNIPKLPNGAPTPSEPSLAQTVGVSGVIEVGGRTQVIVRLPNESFSRYVEVGDRIYDGKIKIKRVEGEQTLSPIVILEESGVEVSRKVGDIAGAPIKEAAK